MITLQQLYNNSETVFSETPVLFISSYLEDLRNVLLQATKQRRPNHLVEQQATPRNSCMKLLLLPAS